MNVTTTALSTFILSMGLSSASVQASSTVGPSLSNYQGTYTCYPEAIYEPNDIEEVQRIV